MLFSCRKYVILERSSWKRPSALSKNCVSIFIYFCINICFCIKQANKICTLLSSHLLAFIVFSVRCCCFMRGILFWSPIQTLTPPNSLLRLFTQDFYHGTTMIDNTKTISCTVRATYYARTDLFRRTNV